MPKKPAYETDVMPTHRELAQSIQKVEETLSEVLVLLYHVIQDHQEVMAAVREQDREPEVPVARMLAFEPRSRPDTARGM